MNKKKLLGIVICSMILVAPLLAVEGVKTPAKKDFKPLSLLPKDAAFIVVVDMKKVVDTKYYNKFKEEQADLDDYSKFIDKTGIFFFPVFSRASFFTTFKFLPADITLLSIMATHISGYFLNNSV